MAGYSENICPPGKRFGCQTVWACGFTFDDHRCPGWEGGDVDEDLRVLYWHEAPDLESQLLQELVSDTEAMTGTSLNPDRKFELWAAARKDSSGKDDPTLTQVLSPYRGELFGTESLNAYIQVQANGSAL